LTDTVFALITTLGPLAIFLSAFLSCLALPVPTSLMMLAGGAFAATGDLDLATVILSAYAGAVTGDQAGFAIGRIGGPPVLERMARAPARAAVLKRARALVARFGGIGVFLSTWAVAPLGPWVNFVAGATGLSWARFTVWDILGETVWVTLYVGLGYTFANQIDLVSAMAGNVSGFVAAVVVAAGAMWWIRSALKAKRGANRE